jgi:hypothetical protein
LNGDFYMMYAPIAHNVEGYPYDEYVIESIVCYENVELNSLP